MMTAQTMAMTQDVLTTHNMLCVGSPVLYEMFYANTAITLINIYFYDIGSQ